MYGKLFASTFTGSMYGAGPVVFAVWGYVIGNVIDSSVELNVKLIASALGTTEEAVQEAIDHLLKPDPNSRSKTLEGRRLVKEGQFSYHVPNHELYRSIRNEEERREYNRRKQAESRARRKSNRVKRAVIDKSAVSAQTDTIGEMASGASSSNASITKECISLGRLATREEGAE